LSSPSSWNALDGNVRTRSVYAVPVDDKENGGKGSQEECNQRAKLKEERRESHHKGREQTNKAKKRKRRAMPLSSKRRSRFNPQVHSNSVAVARTGVGICSPPL
jgi:hypothetical protein